MTTTRRHIEETLESQRFIASQASREQSSINPVSMLYTLQVLVADGRTDEAKRRYAEYKASLKGAE